MTRYALLTSGGDAPGMNAAIRAVVKSAAGRGIEVLGVQGGYDGLIDGRLRPLTRQAGDRLLPDPQVDHALDAGGTFLGSARSMRFLDPAERAVAVKNLEDIDGLIVIGGNGTMAGAHVLAGETDTAIVGIPASIDNDIGCTSVAIGVDTALNTIVEACGKIADTASAHRRAFIIEVMGRQSGYLAMASAVTAGADGVLFREQGRDEDEVVESVEAVIRRAFERDRDKGRVLIMKAEGVDIPCTRLVRLLNARIEDLGDVECRAIVLGHLVRGGSPSHMDRMIGGRFGIMAVEALLEGGDGVMVAWQSRSEGGSPTSDPHIQRFDLAQVLAETEALLDGSSPVTKRRVRMMEAIEGVLAL